MKTICPCRSSAHLAGLRLLDLDDHVGPGVDFLRAGDHLGAVADVLLVGQSRAHAGRGLDQHLMAGAGEFLGPHGQQAHAIFIRFDFLGHSDDHALFSVR